MNRNEFEQLLYLVLDGEAQEADQARFDAAVAGSAEFRARFDFETELQSRLTEALHEDPDRVAHARVMMGFREALAAEENLPVETQAKPAWRRFGIPAAAAAAVMLAFWLGSQSGTKNAQDGPISDSSLMAELNRPAALDLVTAIRASEIHFRQDVEKEREKVGCPRRSAEHCLDRDPESKVWSQGCGVDCKARLAEAQAMAAKCIGEDMNALGLPKGFELVGYRLAMIEFGENRLTVPHLVFMSDDCRVSAYVICEQNGSKILEGLHELESGDKSGDACLWGCPQKGLVVRRVGKAWIAISADLSLDRLTKIASDF